MDIEEWEVLPDSEFQELDHIVHNHPGLVGPKSSDDNKLQTKLDLVVPSTPTEISTDNTTMIKFSSSNQHDRSAASTMGTSPPSKDENLKKGGEGEDMMSRWEEKGGEAEDDDGVGKFRKSWSWSVKRGVVVAICSVCIATISVLIFNTSSHSRNRNQHKHKQLQFQNYDTSDKRIKQVMQNTTRMNEAISMAKGVPFNIAHFTVGGNFDHAV